MLMTYLLIEYVLTEIFTTLLKVEKKTIQKCNIYYLDHVLCMLAILCQEIFNSNLHSHYDL